MTLILAPQESYAAGTQTENKTRNSLENTEWSDIPILTLPHQQLDGVLASHDFFVQLPDHISFREGSELLLSYYPSQLLLQESSTMTVSINGVNLQSVRIGGVENSSLKKSSIRMPISSENLRVGWNKFSIQCLMQTTRTPCRDVDNPAAWLAIEGDSHLHLAFYRLKMFPELQRFPQSIAEERILHPVTSPESDSKPAPTISLLFPSKMQDVHLRALAIISARLAQLSYLTEDDYDLKDLSNWTTESKNRNGVIIATRDELTQAALPADIIAKISKLNPNQGLIAEFIETSAPIQRRWIVATGADEIGLGKAALALGNAHTLETAPSNPLIIDSSPVIPPWIEEIAKPAPSKVTLQTLGAEQITFSGAFRSEKSIPWRFPPGFELAEGSRLHLEFNHTDGLLETSAIEFLVNGNHIGSVVLTPNNATTSSTDIFLPAGLTGADPTRLTFRTYLDIGTVDCGHRYNERAWATISGTSFLDMQIKPLNISSLNQLGLFLLKDAFLRQATLLVPENLTQNELKAVCNLIWKLGKALPSSPVLWPEVCTYAPNRLPPQEKLEGHSVLLLGSISQWKDALPSSAKLPLTLTDSPENKIISMNGQRVSFLQFEPTLAFVQMSVSPWSKEDILVTAGGWDGFAIPSVKKILTDSEVIKKLTVNACAIDTKGRVVYSDFRPPEPESLLKRFVRWLTGKS